MGNLNKAKVNIQKVLSAFSYTGKDYFCSAIITAAGSSTRMNTADGEHISKQLLELCGKSVLEYSIRAFDESKYCNEIIVVSKASELDEIVAICKSLKLLTKYKIVTGGDSRAESVKNGFLAISEESKYIAIHDGARPLITAKAIDKLYEISFRKGAACAATKVSDSMKRADENGNITESVDRNNLYAVQTPQVFMRDIYAAALATSDESKEYTDDCGIVSDAGFKIRLFDIGKDNIKLTTREDIHFAEALMKVRNEK